MSDFKPVEGEFTGRHMLYIMIAFFGVIIAVNLVMLTVATRSWTGLVVKNSYVASQKFNDVLSAAEKQKRLGWKSGVVVTTRSAKVRITGSESSPVAGLSVKLALSRPVHEAEDRTLELLETAPGEYAVEADLGSGVWNAELMATSASGQDYRMIHRIFVEDPSS